MTVYAESSAVLSWLFLEHRREEVVTVLAEADGVCTSRVTILECARALIRSVQLERLTVTEASAGEAEVTRASARWALLDVVPAVLERAGSTFPVEPVRALDALHLASALHIRATSPDLAILSLDERIRANADALGFDVLP